VRPVLRRGFHDRAGSLHDREGFRHHFAYETDPDLGSMADFTTVTVAPMIGRDFVTILRTKPIPILIRQ